MFTTAQGATAARLQAANALSDEEALPGRAAAQRELQALTVQYLEDRLPDQVGYVSREKNRRS